MGFDPIDAYYHSHFCGFLSHVFTIARHSMEQNQYTYSSFTINRSLLASVIALPHIQHFIMITASIAATQSQASDDYKNTPAVSPSPAASTTVPLYTHHHGTSTWDTARPDRP